jgi:hypothetical protein
MGGAGGENEETSSGCSLHRPALTYIYSGRCELDDGAQIVYRLET